LFAFVELETTVQTAQRIKTTSTIMVYFMTSFLVMKYSSKKWHPVQFQFKIKIPGTATGNLPREILEFGLWVIQSISKI
jgi:hypothetical protein